MGTDIALQQNIKDVLEKARLATDENSGFTLPSTTEGLIGFPYISFDKQSFTLVNGDDQTKLARTGPLRIVLAHWAEAKARIFYGRAFSATDKSPPKCWSADGIKPAAIAIEPQNNTCNGCPKDSRGSGSDGTSKACSQTLPMLAYVMDKDYNGLAQFRVGGGSYYGEVADTEMKSKGYMNWNELFRLLGASGGAKVDPRHLVLNMAFDTGRGAHPSKLVCSIAANTPEAVREVITGLSEAERKASVRINFPLPKEEDEATVKTSQKSKPAQIEGTVVDSTASVKTPNPTAQSDKVAALKAKLAQNTGEDL